MVQTPEMTERAKRVQNRNRIRLDKVQLARDDEPQPESSTKTRKVGKGREKTSDRAEEPNDESTEENEGPGSKTKGKRPRDENSIGTVC